MVAMITYLSRQRQQDCAQWTPRRLRGLAYEPGVFAFNGTWDALNIPTEAGRAATSAGGSTARWRGSLRAQSSVTTLPASCSSLNTSPAML